MTNGKPRVWQQGDPEPMDAPPVRDVLGYVWTHRPSCALWRSPGTALASWTYILKWAPLTEVLDSED